EGQGGGPDLRKGVNGEVRFRKEQQRRDASLATEDVNEWTPYRQKAQLLDDAVEKGVENVRVTQARRIATMRIDDPRRSERAGRRAVLGGHRRRTLPWGGLPRGREQRGTMRARHFPPRVPACQNAHER